ncbi:MAG TPA: PqqD family protein [Pyrinomonadaceae bacterium]|jgi:hypothetical protein
MNNSPRRLLPAARRDEIITREVDGELLIYDRARDKAHCLNETAAAIWKRCDGRTTARDIANSIAQETGGATDERVVWLGLDELRRKHLLVEIEPWPQSMAGSSTFSRRDVIRRIGLGAAIALPVVITITAPTPAQAGTCKSAGQPCGTSSQCCSGSCSGGTCLGGPLNREGGARRR